MQTAVGAKGRTEDKPMKIQYQVVQDDNYLLVTTSGRDYSPDDSAEYASAVIRTAGEYMVMNVLCDERDPGCRLTGTESYQLAAAIFEHAPWIGKVAIVCCEESLESSYMDFVNPVTGVQVKMTSDIDEARSWLAVQRQLQEAW